MVGGGRKEILEPGLQMLLPVALKKGFRAV